MIVKDEEDCIGNCLSSIEKVVDEIIIVDTGSSDRTVEICKSFGAQVYEFPWNKSFSDARNFGLERATGDWILWLDADEEVESSDVYKLRDILYSDEDILSIHLMNYYGERPEPDKTFDIAHARLLRNHIGFKFIGKIHEMINTDEVLTIPEDGLIIKTVPIKVHHYGYMASVTENKKKFERNLTMLQEELKQKDHNPWIHYHIASEYYNKQEFSKAFDHVNHSIKDFLKLLQAPPSLLYRLKYSILINTGSIEGAWPGIEKVLILYPDYVDLHFYKGIILYLKDMFKDALKAFEHCLEMGEENLQHLTIKGVGSFQALHYKGCCLEKLGQIEEAARCYAMAARQSKTFDSPVEALRELMAKQQDLFSPLTEECDDETLIAKALTIHFPKKLD
ncbi:glycosyltransferase [Neobacillus sp. NPDC093127]|uniref:glycosyltransferase n=1 Tax=Neobacillus sp. NPDC093127 TaxID=3364296 RepID=UPI003825E5ED